MAQEAKFDRAAARIFTALGVLDVVAGAAFALGADYFGFDRRIAWTAGGLFMVMGIGMLVFVAGRRGDRGG